MRAMETLPRLAHDAKTIGFADINFYEAANMIELNPEGVSYSKGLAPSAMAATRALLARKS